MKTKLLIIFTALLLYGIAVKAQSIFSIKYRFTNIQDTSLYNVFLVRFDDGTGFYRVSFFDPESNDYMIVELEMEETVFKDKNGHYDETKIYFKGSDPHIIYGDKNYHYYPERFWFRLDQKTGWYEPWAVTSPDEKGTAQGRFVSAPELIEQADLTEQYVADFFLEDEEFYQSLFKVTQRSLTPAQKQARLHLILVANTEDETIGATCQLDRARTMKIYKDLSEFMGIGFNAKEIYGSGYNKQAVQYAVQTLQPGADDIVVFYYSGHGFSNPNPAKEFPDMALSNKGYEDARANSWNMEDVYNIIKQKGARFNLVYSDCCNNSPGDNPTLTCDAPKMRNSGLGWSLENCKSLFLNKERKSVLMTAAQRGQMSAGNGASGGFFTYNFRSSLLNFFGPLHLYPTWKTVFETTRKNTTEQSENSRCSERGEALKTYKQQPVGRIE
ncbi:MAG: caspase family protein [Rhizobacter sp.]|nr:caspase family protein [Ferruginibacter sp.]